MSHLTLLLFILLTIILFIITIQDARYRAVSWILFPVLAIVCFIISSMQLSLKTVFLNTLMNVAFITFQLIIISIYFSIKNWNISWILNKYLGLGDILFLYAIVFLFNPVNYIVFLISGFLFALVFSSIYFGLLKPQKKQIPLAGIMSFFLSILVIIKITLKLDLLLDDSFIRILIYKG